MDLVFTMVVPLTIAGVALYGALRRVDVYSALVSGAGSGLETLVRIAPALVGLLTAVYMLRASGALDLAAQALSPLLERVEHNGGHLLFVFTPAFYTAAMEEAIRRYPAAQGFYP